MNTETLRERVRVLEDAVNGLFPHLTHGIRCDLYQKYYDSDLPVCSCGRDQAVATAIAALSKEPRT